MNAIIRNIVTFFVLFAAGALIGFSYGRKTCSEERYELQQKVAEKINESTGASATVQIAAAEKVVEIKTVFKDRVVYRDREVPVEVRIREDAQCVVPDRFVRMWNSANRGELPDTAGQPDARPDRAEGAAAEGGREALGR